MNNAVARDLANRELEQLRSKAYNELVQFIKDVATKELVGPDDKTYQCEIQAAWDDKKGGDVRVMVAVDDCGWRAFAPLCVDFIMRPDGSFVDE